MGIRVKYEDLNAVVYCKCGCGRKLTKRQKQVGGVYASMKCANRKQAKERTGKKRGPYNKKKEKGATRRYIYEKDGVSYRGTDVCLNFNNENITCVICYEQGLFRKKECRVKEEDKVCDSVDNAEI